MDKEYPKEFSKLHEPSDPYIEDVNTFKNELIEPLKEDISSLNKNVETLLFFKENNLENSEEIDKFNLLENLKGDKETKDNSGFTFEKESFGG